MSQLELELNPSDLQSAQTVLDPFLADHRARRLATKREYEQLAMARAMVKRLTNSEADGRVNRHGIGAFDVRIKSNLWLEIPNGSSVCISFWRYRDVVRRLGWRVARDLAANSTYYQEKWPIG